MSTDITGIHHIGLIVRDMDAAREAFDRIGFTVDQPAYPALSPPGDPQPVGAGNTHADFAQNFIEIVAIAPQDKNQLPKGAKLIPLIIPEDRLDDTRTAMRQTVASLASRLDGGEGAHILTFATSDADRTADRLEQVKVEHSGVHAAQRPITTAEGTSLESVRYLEISHDDPSGMPPEGRVGAAEEAPAEIRNAQTGLDHANGATALSESIICVDDNGLHDITERYERYLGRQASRADSFARFDFADTCLTLTTAESFEAWLPGEKASTTPSLSAYSLTVADPEETRRLLRSRGIEIGTSELGEYFIPAADALGITVILRSAR